jgi:S1-C subfamily serine protease
LRANAEGVVVTSVDAGTPAAESVQPGDVILEAEREIVRNVGDVTRVVSDAERNNHDVVLFLIERGGQASYEAVRFAN